MEEKLINYYSPVLRKKAKKVRAGEETDNLIERMKNVLQREDGIGLAAPQIGVSRRVIVLKSENDFIAFLNPKIIKKSKEIITCKEGCLSMKGVWIDVIRAKKIKVAAENEKGKAIEIDGEDMMAIVLQHEIDHLDGILFTQRVGFKERTKAVASYIFKKNGTK